MRIGASAGSEYMHMTTLLARAADMTRPHCFLVGSGQGLSTKSVRISFGHVSDLVLPEAGIGNYPTV
jgi:hypothetical protein